MSRETLVQAGHVPPKKWDVTKEQREGGVTRSQFCFSWTHSGKKICQVSQHELRGQLSKTPKKIHAASSNVTSSCRVWKTVRNSAHFKTFFGKANRTFLIAAEGMCASSLQRRELLPHLLSRPCKRRLKTPQCLNLWFRKVRDLWSSWKMYREVTLGASIAGDFESNRQLGGEVHGENLISVEFWEPNPKLNSVVIFGKFYDWQSYDLESFPRATFANTNALLCCWVISDRSGKEKKLSYLLYLIRPYFSLRSWNY